MDCLLVAQGPCATTIHYLTDAIVRTSVRRPCERNKVVERAEPWWRELRAPGRKAASAEELETGKNGRRLPVHM